MDLRTLAEERRYRLSGWTIRRPFFTMGVTALVVTGVSLYLPLWLSVLAAVVLVGCCFIPAWRRPLWWTIALTATVFLLTTAGYRYRMVDSLTDLEGRQDTVTGQVVDITTESHLVTVEVSQARLVPAGMRMSLYLPDEWTPQLWDTLTVRVTLSTNSMSNYQAARDVQLHGVALAYEETAIAISDGTKPLFARWGDGLERALRQALPGQEGDVLAALCLGRRTHLSQSVESAFRQSGIAHLLVVSGLHLSLLVVAVRLLLRRSRLGLRCSATLTIPVMAVLMGLVGVTPSVARAGIMCLCWLSGILCHRRTEGLNSLGLAAVVLLLQNPYQLYSAGFQLSFLATAGVLCLAPRLCRWLYRRPLAHTFWRRQGQRVFRFAYTSMAVCFSAILFTLPVSCYYFGGFTVLTLFTNLLAVVPAGWVLFLGWIGILCSAIPFLSWLGQPILWLAGVGARYLLQVAEWGSVSGAQVAVSHLWQWLLLTVLCLLIAYLLLAQISLRRTLPYVLALAVLSLTVGGLFTAPYARLTVQPASQGVAVLLEQGDEAALLATHSHALDEALELLEKEERTHLDYLVVAKGSPGDVDALAEIHRRTEAPQVITIDEDDWFVGFSDPVHRLSHAEPVSLWEGCTLTPITKTWWQIACGGDPVQVGGDPGIPCPHPEGLAIYAGMPSVVRTPAVVICTPEDLARTAASFAEETVVLTEESMTFTVRPGGEWSVLPWL